MSETVSAGSASTSSATAATTSQASGTPGSGGSDASKTQSAQGTKTQGYNNQTGESAKTSAESQNSASATDAKNQADDGYEEVKLGSTSGRVPKEIAKAIKDLERGFQTKAQEVASAKKLIALGKQNPKEFLRQTGMDPYDFAESTLAEKYEEMTLTKEQKEARDKDLRLQKYESAEKQSKQELISKLKDFGDKIPENIEQYSKEEIAEYVQHRSEQYRREEQNLDHEIGKAFTESGLQPDKHTLAKVAFEIATAARQNKNLSAPEALAKVIKGLTDGNRERYSKLDGKRIHEELGEEVIAKIRKYDLERVNENAAFKIGQQNGHGSNPSSQGNQQKKTLNEVEWRKAMGLD